MDSLEICRDEIHASIKKFFNGKGFNYIIFAFETGNPNGFAFTGCTPDQYQNMAKDMRKFANKIENGEVFPLTQGGIQ